MLKEDDVVQQLIEHMPSEHATPERVRELVSDIEYILCNCEINRD